VKSAESIAHRSGDRHRGWSLLGELLTTTAAHESPCAIALGAKPSASRETPADAQKAPLPADLGKALGRIFGR
jgi:hypothetical protein